MDSGIFALFSMPTHSTPPPPPLVVVFTLPSPVPSISRLPFFLSWLSGNRIFKLLHNFYTQRSVSFFMAWWQQMLTPLSLSSKISATMKWIFRSYHHFLFSLLLDFERDGWCDCCVPSSCIYIDIWMFNVTIWQKNCSHLSSIALFLFPQGFHCILQVIVSRDMIGRVGSCFVYDKPKIVYTHTRQAILKFWCGTHNNCIQEKWL